MATINGFCICASCDQKYPRIRNGENNDLEALEKYGCEVCEGDTDPALFGYGTEAQQSEARWFARPKSEW